jgi:hypothetical protein
MSDYETITRPDQPVDADLIIDVDAAAAVIRVTIDGTLRTFIGSSKKHPNDEHDHRIGGMFALARAFAQAARELKAEAQVIVDKRARVRDVEERRYGLRSAR